MTDPHRATLFHLSAPLFLQSMVLFAVMAIDMKIWSAHGQTTATALSVAGQVMRVAVELSTVLGIGAVILISQHLGRGQIDTARRTAMVASVASVGLGVAIGVAMAIGGPLMLRLMELPALIEAEGRLYLQISAATLVALSFGNTAVACLRGFGLSRTVMRLGLGGAAVYLALEYLFVLGAGPVQALGVAGAGLANLATRLIFAAVLVATLARLLHLRASLRVTLAHLSEVRQMIRLALPSVSDFIAYGFYQLVLIGFIASHGDVELLSRAYVMIAMSFLTLVIMAIVQGTEVLIGYRIGAGNAADARRIGLRSALIGAALSMGCALVLYLGAGRFVGFFTQDPQVIDLCRRLLGLTILIQPGFACNMVLFHALRAVEDVRWPVLVSQGLSWGLGLPLAWVLCVPLGLGIVGVWYAFIAEETAKALAMTLRWHSRRRLNLPG